MGSLSTVEAITSGFAGQAGNTGEAAQTILTRSTTSSWNAGIALIASVASRTHGTRGAGHTRLLLQLLHFGRQSACSSVTNGAGRMHDILQLTDFILKVSYVTNAGVVVG